MADAGGGRSGGKGEVSWSPIFSEQVGVGLENELFVFFGKKQGESV